MKQGFGMKQEALFLFLGRRDVFCLHSEQVACSVCWSLWMSWRKQRGRIIVRGWWPTWGRGDVPSPLSPGEMQGPGSLVCWWWTHEENMQSCKISSKHWGPWFWEIRGKNIFQLSLWLFFMLLNWQVGQGLESITCGRSVVGFFSSFVLFFTFLKVCFVSGHCTVCRDTTQAWQSHAGVSSSWRMGRGWTVCWGNRFFRLSSVVGRPVS